MSNMKKRIVALIQARIGSTRLPGKVMIDICGRPAIWHIVNRLRHVPEIDEVVVATSISFENGVLEKFCRNEQIQCFRGSENEVLDRFYHAAKHYKADVIVRITGDCPLIDPQSVSLAIHKFLEEDEQLDYVSLATGAGAFNKTINKYPDGTDTEVVSFHALERAWKEAKDPLDRGESVLSYIWRRKNIFQCKLIPFSRNLGNLRWTLDRPNDLDFIRKIYEKLYKPDYCFSMMDVLRLLEAEPSLSKINEAGIGKEGYEKYWQK